MPLVLQKTREEKDNLVLLVVPNWPNGSPMADTVMEAPAVSSDGHYSTPDQSYRTCMSGRSIQGVGIECATKGREPRRPDAFML